MNAEQIASANGCYDRHINEAARYVLTPERRARFVRMGLIQLPQIKTGHRLYSEITPEEREQMRRLIAKGCPSKTIAARFNVTPHTVSKIAPKRR